MKNDKISIRCIWEQREGLGYSDSMTSIFDIRTIMEFWQFWQHCPQPSTLFEQKCLVSMPNKEYNTLSIFLYMPNKEYNTLSIFWDTQIWWHRWKVALISDPKWLHFVGLILMHFFWCSFWMHLNKFSLCNGGISLVQNGPKQDVKNLVENEIQKWGRKSDTNRD